MSSDSCEGRRKIVVGVTVGASAFSLLRGQLAWFKRTGWDVTLVASPDEAAKQAAAREGVFLAGIPMERGLSPVLDGRSLVTWVRLLRNQRPDAVNVGTPKAALLGTLAAWLVRIPRRLYVVRGLRLEGTSGFLAGVLWCSEKLIVHLATDVLYVSNSLADESKKRGLMRTDKSWVIGSGSSNGVNAKAVLDRVRAVDQVDIRAKLGFDPRDFVAAFVGRITRDKGVDTLIKALSSSTLDPNIRGLLVGRIEDPRLDREIKSLGDRIVHIPWTADVWAYFAAMDVLCLPTRREGFPNVVLEAAAAGVPTITTRATGARDSVVEGKTGLLIDVGDHQRLVENLNKLCVRRSLNYQLGEAARRRAFEEYSQEKIWKGLTEILSGDLSPKYARRVESNDN